MLDHSGAKDFAGALRAFGLTENEARTYLALLRLGRQTPGQLAPRAGVSRGRIYQVLGELERKGFAVETADRKRTYRAVEPPSALAAILESEQARTRQLSDLAAEFTPRLVELQRAVEDAGRGHPAVEVLARPDQIGPRFRQLEDQAKTEVLLFTKGPVVMQDNFEALAGMARGVRHATIYERHLLDDPLTCRLTLQDMAAGEQVRAIDQLPMKMAVFDRELALLPLASVEDPQAPFTLVVVHDTGLADTLAHAFDHLWEQADPVEPKELRASADVELA